MPRKSPAAGVCGFLEGARGKLAIAAACAFATTATADTTIGRWCDRTLPGMPQYNAILEIVIADDGRVMLRMPFGDGSSVEWELREQSGRIFEKIGSVHGDKYRIVPSTGNLQLLDHYV